MLMGGSKVEKKKSMVHADGRLRRVEKGLVFGQTKPIIQCTDRGKRKRRAVKGKKTPESQTCYRGSMV